MPDIAEPPVLHARLPDSQGGLSGPGIPFFHPGHVEDALSTRPWLHVFTAPQTLCLLLGALPTNHSWLIRGQ